ncbi:MAG TPA: ABC transporter permease [Pyrinomonadaceae bacterium]|jgi:lipopolysaccharide transport system permease protein
MSTTTSKTARSLKPVPTGSEAAPGSGATPLHLPDKPLVTIKPSSAWVALDLRDLWAYRDLFYFLTRRDVIMRYKQTALGAAWAIMQPLFTMLIFSLIFGKLAGMKSDGVPYPLFAYAGLLPWTFFANAVTNSGNSLIGNANLITKVYFPRMMIPGAAVTAGLVDFAIAFGLLAVLMVYYQVAPTWNLLMLLPLVLLTTLLALSVGMWMSAVNVKYRDIRYTLPFMIQLWFFATPIIYPASLVPERWQWVVALNPMAGVIEGYRAALFGRPTNWRALGFSAVITFAMLVYSAYAFRRMERRFADVI